MKDLIHSRVNTLMREAKEEMTSPDAASDEAVRLHWLGRYTALSDLCDFLEEIDGAD